MTFQGLALAAALSLSLPTATLASAPRADGEPVREELARQIVSKWSSHVREHYPVGPDAWAVEMAPAFADASLEELQAAASATNFKDMNRILLGQEPRDATNALGDTAADLVFIPVTPCRLFDTRLAGGAIAANSVRAFDINVAGSFAGQGGENNDCGVGTDGPFAAAVINLTVVTPSTAGYITAFPLGAAQPLAATVNYTAGAIVGNEVIVKLDQGPASAELNVYSFAQTHLVGDIVGYFAAPRATPIECVQLTNFNNNILPGGSVTVSTAACATGYTSTGGSCTSSSFGGRVVSTRTSNTGHFCAFQNEGDVTMTGTAYARCCRVPGR